MLMQIDMDDLSNRLKKSRDKELFSERLTQYYKDMQNKRDRTTKKTPKRDK